MRSYAFLGVSQRWNVPFTVKLSALGTAGQGTAGTLERGVGYDWNVETLPFTVRGLAGARLTRARLERWNGHDTPLFSV